MELKLLAIAERQSDTSLMARHQDLEAAVRAELEGRPTLLAELERTVTVRTDELAQAFTTRRS